MAVLSDEKRRTLYDAGLYDPVQDDEYEVEVQILFRFCSTLFIIYRSISY